MICPKNRIFIPKRFEWKVVDRCSFRNFYDCRGSDRFSFGLFLIVSPERCCDFLGSEFLNRPFGAVDNIRSKSRSV
ncbi:hypothetical protein LEP1GSC040_3609 [Leptospira santarosai str. 2000030832]|nr:hypothetical protein LEP1GSC040_3609 [Leptospira santarosai str. 2000030832]